MVVVKEDVKLVGVNEERRGDGVIGNSPKANKDKGQVSMPIYTRGKNRIEQSKQNNRCCR